ncbi:hypothetical protein [[Clostridium] aminophilum]|uniref:Uncharacterized protein n=1 Tax=[Clostridium] aminophilum TaxID=1526 RepID=A0A1I6ISG1_9FIRM|nr:hypothetical protein [[Clostridium] aminophilum]SFR69684.1 hypothetical protein SAMN02910262_00752 [[Clostridium] aminophilum]
MGVFKDRVDINNKTAEEKNMKELADICRKSFTSPDSDMLLKKLLIGEVSDTDKRHHEKHDLCSGCKSDSETEKRICRCMYYYDKNPSICEGCNLPRRWKNIGDIEVTEYEIPTEQVMEGIGGMDLILDGKYAAEIKKPYSKETLVRMLAEILTYTIGSKYKPAIALFEGSYQWESFKKHSGEDSLAEILKHVAVFQVSVEYEDNLAKYRIFEIAGKR